MTYASVGNGTFYHLLGEQMSKLVGAEMTHVPYKGGGPIVADLMGKQIDIFISPYAAPHIEMAKSGKLKIIGALSPTRQRMLPDVPSVDEGKALRMRILAERDRATTSAPATRVIRRMPQ